MIVTDTSAFPPTVCHIIHFILFIEQIILVIVIAMCLSPRKVSQSRCPRSAKRQGHQYQARCQWALRAMGSGQLVWCGIQRCGVSPISA